MTRTVVANRQVAHIWANQGQSEARSNNGQFYFEGPTIFSYRASWPLATFLDKKTVVYNDEKYGVTTAKHLNMARSALHGALEIAAPRIMVRGLLDGHPSARTSILQYHVTELEAFARNLANPRYRVSWNTEVNSAEGRCALLDARKIEVAKIAKALGLKSPSVNLAKHYKAIGAAFAKFYDPKAMAKRAQARERGSIARFAKIVANLTRHARNYYICYRDRVRLEGAAAEALGYDEAKARPILRRYQTALALMEQEAAFEAAHPDAQQVLWNKQASAPFRITPEDWQAGKVGRFYQSSPTLLRKRGSLLETSQGASVPWREAEGIWIAAQTFRHVGKAWQANGERLPVGPFEVNTIYANGDVKAGCHLLHFEVMRDLAVKECPRLVKARYPVPALVGMSALQWACEAARRSIAAGRWGA